MSHTARDEQTCAMPCDRCILLSAVWVAGQQVDATPKTKHHHPIHAPLKGMERIIQLYSDDVDVTMDKAGCARVHDVLAHIVRLRSIPVIVGVAREACAMDMETTHSSSTYAGASTMTRTPWTCCSAAKSTLDHASSWCVALMGGVKDVYTLQVPM